MKTGEILGEGVGKTYQILPHVNPWAWEIYLKGTKNNWLPTEVPMSKDIEQWFKPGFLSDDEKLVLIRCLGFFASTESLVADNLAANAMNLIKDPECKQAIARQIFEEALHNHTLVYVCQSLRLSIEEVYEAYVNIPSIKAKTDFISDMCVKLNKTNFDLDKEEDKILLLKTIILFWVVCEGILFFSGFAMLLSFKRQQKLPGICKQIEYTLRDESLHVELGVGMVNKIIEQNPSIWTKEVIEEVKAMVNTAVELEIAYAKDVLPRGILGLNAEMFVSYMQYIANLRLQAIGIPAMYPQRTNPFPWVTQAAGLSVQSNFFESRVTDYTAESGIVDDA